MSARVADVLVLGGGVVGLACAYYLLGEGRSVTVLERDRVGCGSSHGNCGTLTPSHAAPLALPGVLSEGLGWLLRPAAPLRIRPRLDPALLRWLAAFACRCNWRDAIRATVAKRPLLEGSRRLVEEIVRQERLDCEFAALGTMNVYRDPAHFRSACALLDRLAGHLPPCEVIDGAEAVAREPALRPGVAGAIVHPGDAQLRPDRFVAELARVVRARGGAIEEGVAVTGIDADRARVVTSRGEFAGGDLVVALGAWSPRWARPLGLRVPIQPGKGYSITYTRPARCPRIPLTLKEPSVCVTAWDSGFRLGSTMEFAGYDDSLNRTRLDALRRGAAAFLHDAEGPSVVEEWYGWRPMTPDDLPLIGRLPARERVVLATGHGMLGVTMSAGTGRLVADLVARRAPWLDAAAFSPGRFA
jgi:D-amino-acid dehydrogenase